MQVNRALLRWCFTNIRYIRAAKRPSVRSWIRSPVVGDVTRPGAAGLRKRHPCRHPAVPAEAASVGDELRCPSGLLVVKVRAHHPAPPSTALVEGGGADRLQVGSPCLQVPARGSTIVPRRRALPVGRPRLDVAYVLPRHRR